MFADNRKLFQSLLDKISRGVSHWETQEAGVPHELNIAPQLQNFMQLNPQVANKICQLVEMRIMEASENMIVQLAQTAYATLETVGYDCSSFEWAMEA